MTFNSIQYFVFFAVVLALYFRFGRIGQNRLMVVAGGVFYGFFDPRFLILLSISIVFDFIIALQIEKSDDDRARRRLFAASIVVELGILGTFKYANFFADSARDLLGSVGFEADFFTLNILLPVGISFYTFQSLAYVRSVYRREIAAEKDLITYAAFVSWFPQLVAGPIERAASLLPQVKRCRGVPEAPVFESGVILILQGLFKKVVIADGVATYVAAAYDDPGLYSSRVLILATVGFAVQVYGDFSAYTDIARGSSRLLGVELRRNFEQPFLSRDIREFWQRWHTSLSGWFVEFVAQPLGASRRSPGGSAVIVVFMFTLIGLWHGAAWTFVFWGFANGVAVALWRFVPTPKRRHPMRVRWREAPSIMFTFGLFCLGAIFFRADSFDAATTVISRIVNGAQGASPHGGYIIPFAVLGMFVLDVIERRQRVEAIEVLRTRAQLGSVATAPEAVIESTARALPLLPSGLMVGIMVLGIVLFSGGDPVPFVYFQF